MQDKYQTTNNIQQKHATDRICENAQQQNKMNRKTKHTKPTKEKTITINASCMKNIIRSPGTKK